jgi:hypothetical protein
MKENVDQEALMADEVIRSYLVQDMEGLKRRYEFASLSNKVVYENIKLSLDKIIKYTKENIV